MPAVVDFHALGQVIWVSLLAGVGVTVLFSLAIASLARADEARRLGNGGAAMAYGAAAVLALVVFAVAVILGVTIMLHK